MKTCKVWQRWPKDGNLTFAVTMNVVFLDVYCHYYGVFYRILACVVYCPSVAVSGCLLLCVAVWICCRRKLEISRSPNHVAGHKGKILFLRGTTSRLVHLEFNCADVVENTAMWLFYPIRFKKRLIHFFLNFWSALCVSISYVFVFS